MFDSKRRILIFLILSIAFGVSAVFLFLNYIKKTEETLGEHISIYAAKTDIPAGTPIALDMLTTVSLPKKYVVPTFAQVESDIKNKISLVPITSGEVLSTAMLRSASNVPSKKRLVQLRAPMAVFDDEFEVLDKVDLIGTYEAQGERVTEVIATEIEVLRVYRTGESVLSLGVALSQEETEQIIWLLNFGKELRVLKSNNTYIQIREGE